MTLQDQQHTAFFGITNDQDIKSGNSAIKNSSMYFELSHLSMHRW